MITNEICVYAYTWDPSPYKTQVTLFRTFIFHHKNGFSQDQKDNISSIIKQPEIPFLAFSHMTALLLEEVGLAPQPHPAVLCDWKQSCVSVQGKVKPSSTLWAAEEAEKSCWKSPKGARALDKPKWVKSRGWRDQTWERPSVVPYQRMQAFLKTSLWEKARVRRESMGTIQFV